jgi:hypothetical protein
MKRAVTGDGPYFGFPQKSRRSVTMRLALESGHPQGRFPFQYPPLTFCCTSSRMEACPDFSNNA